MSNKKPSNPTLHLIRIDWIQQLNVRGETSWAIRDDSKIAEPPTNSFPFYRLTDRNTGHSIIVPANQAIGTYAPECEHCGAVAVEPRKHGIGHNLCTKSEAQIVAERAKAEEMAANAKALEEIQASKRRELATRG